MCCVTNFEVNLFNASIRYLEINYNKALPVIIHMGLVIALPVIIHMGLVTWAWSYCCSHPCQLVMVIFRGMESKAQTPWQTRWGTGPSDCPCPWICTSFIKIIVHHRINYLCKLNALTHMLIRESNYMSIHKHFAKCIFLPFPEQFHCNDDWYKVFFPV